MQAGKVVGKFRYLNVINPKVCPYMNPHVNVKMIIRHACRSLITTPLLSTRGGVVRPLLFTAPGLQWQRYQSDTVSRLKDGQKKSTSFWTAGRTFLFSAFIGSLTYVYGVTDAGSRFNKLLVKDKNPKYGSPKDLDKVGLHIAPAKNY